MLLEAQNHGYRQRRILAYKPTMDDRYSKTEITTHSGMVSLPAVTIEVADDLITHVLQQDIAVENTTIVLDEVFMVPKIGKQLVWLYRNGFSLLVSSLDLSSAMEPFLEIVEILPWVTDVQKCTAVCQVCRADARYTYRKPGAGDDIILVGGVETYEARCSSCHPFFKVT
jgi:thymidine kinase